MTILKQKSFSAVRWTSLSMLGRAVLSLLQVMVLSRLLTPSDFGLMALVAAVIAFVKIFSDLGISNAVFHKQSISQEVLSSLYWLNVSASSALMLILILISPFIALWYQDPRMESILELVSLSFLIVALGQQIRILAEKNLRFKQLAKIELLSSIISFVVSVAIAMAGGGVFALVAGQLTNVFVTTVLIWWILADGWRPMWRMRYGEIKEFLGFGLYMLGFSLTNTLNMQADILIGGRVIGTSSLGIYSLPKDLSMRLGMIINPIVTRVGLPVMAQAQGDKALLKSIYLKTLLMTASINFPLYFIIAIFAPEIVAIMFGENWQESAPLLRIFAIWGLVRSTGNPSGSLVFAMGRARLAYWWSLGLTLFQIPSYWLGAKFGVTGLAIALLISMLVTPIPQWYILIRPLSNAGFFEYFKRLSIPFFTSALAGLISYIVAIPFETPIFRLTAGISIGGLAYLGLSRLLNKTWFAAITELLLGKIRSSKLLA